MKRFNYPLIAIITLVTSCSYFEVIEAEKPIKTTPPFVNNYDWIGLAHNDALDEFTTESGFPYGSREVYWDFAKDYYLRDYYHEGGEYLEEIEYSDLSSNLEAYLDGNNLAGLANALYNNNKISLAVKDALLDIHSVLNNEILFQNGSMSGTIAELDVIEQEFLEESYSISDETLILGAISVARHSTMFWDDAWDNNNNPYNAALVSGGKFWTIVAVVGADIGGFAAGFAAGFGLGSLFGLDEAEAAKVGASGGVTAGGAASKAVAG